MMTALQPSLRGRREAQAEAIQSFVRDPGLLRRQRRLAMTWHEQ
jgi:hypothetical protein